MTDTFDHARVGALLRIIHDTVNLTGMETIRDAAAKELEAISIPLKVAKEKEVADAKAKADAKAAEAVAKHKNFHPDTAASLTALKKNVDDTEVAAEKAPTAANIAAHEAASKAYADALKAAEAAAHPPRAIPSAQTIADAVRSPSADSVKRV